MRTLACVVVLGGLALAADGPKKEAAVPKAKLWAGLGLNTAWPAIEASQVVDSGFFSVSFALVNDGDEAVKPDIVESSQFLVNGKELKDWKFIVGNGPRGKEFDSLPPGQSLRFGIAMGRAFAEPGVYKIQWKGKGFESPVVEFRVLPVPPG